MLRSIIPAVALALGLTACHPQGRPVAGAAPAPVAHHAVVAGESNRFFTARSEQAVAIAPDVRSTPVRDGGGHQKGFRLIAGDNRVATVTCECPASCSAAGYRPLSSGCWTLDDSSEQCWEACGVPDNVVCVVWARLLGRRSGRRRPASGGEQPRRHRNC
jgi:hypothetical protein